MKHKTKILHLKNGYDLWGASFGDPNSPIKILALHGGPGDDADEFIVWADQLKKFARIDAEVFVYEQLGSFHSESPDFSKKENVDNYLNYNYYINEVEEVRQLFDLDNFYLAGHSWGGILAYEYMLRSEYRQHLKAGIVFSMNDNIDDYVKQINKELLDMFGEQEFKYMKRIETSGDFSQKRYHQNLIELYKEHLNRDPNYNPDDGMKMMAEDVYHHFQGNNEFVVTGEMKNWNVSSRLPEIDIPVLETVGEFDTMSVESAKRSAQKLPRGRFALTENGGHSHAQDHPKEFFEHLGSFIKDVEAGNV